MTIRTMQYDDLERVLDWAAVEGWNPGLEDASAFWQADPEGLFVKEVAGQPAAAISVVNHDPDMAFLGLYICRPEFRGQGYGIELWNTALSHTGNRCVGLDGVPDQQANYRRSGFEPNGKTVRYSGYLPKTAPAPLATGMNVDFLVEADAHFVGFARNLFAAAWFVDSDTRQTFALDAQNFATARKCRDGVKIGPLYAASQWQLESLMSAISNRFPGEMMIVDIPGQSAALAEYLSDLTFKPAFETARMYKGVPPVQQPPLFAATATLELG